MSGNADRLADSLAEAKSIMSPSEYVGLVLLLVFLLTLATAVPAFVLAWAFGVSFWKTLAVWVVLQFCIISPLASRRG